ncbi:MAG: LLM class flavin-dependent oxidoreductase, partial [Gaiellales bacterium]
EMENHGADPARRWKLLRERVEAMKAIWTQDEAEYHGELVDFDPIWQWPKPIQKPHPPIFIGGSAPAILPRVIAYCDGWLPIGQRAQNDFRESAAELARLADDAGRPRPRLSIFGSDVTADMLERHREAGAERVVLAIPSEPADVVVPLLERYAELGKRYLPT